MTKNQELLQRCFDNDLNDEEMKHLFTALAGSKNLRQEYGSLQHLKNELSAAEQPSAPASLDRRIEAMVSPFAESRPALRSPLRLLFVKQISIRAALAAATILVLLTSSYFILSPQQSGEPETKYVYIVQLPPVVVTSYLQ